MIEVGSNFETAGEAAVLAVAAASVEALVNAQRAEGDAPASSSFEIGRKSEVERARSALALWCEEVGAPPIELRRALRRISASWAQTPRARLREALAHADNSEAAKRLVEALSEHDRDLEWDVPLRDVARALVRSAVTGARG